MLAQENVPGDSGVPPLAVLLILFFLALFIGLFALMRWLRNRRQQ